MFLEIQLRAALAGNDMTGPVRLRMTRIASLLGFNGAVLASLEAALRGAHAGLPARRQPGERGEPHAGRVPRAGGRARRHRRRSW